MQQATEGCVSFTVRRTACELYPISTRQGASRQVHAERVVCELSDPAHTGAIGFDYHTEAGAGRVDVVLTVRGTDEIKVREAAQRLDEHYHGQPFYEEEVNASWR